MNVFMEALFDGQSSDYNAKTMTIVLVAYRISLLVLVVERKKWKDLIIKNDFDIVNSRKKIKNDFLLSTS